MKEYEESDFFMQVPTFTFFHKMSLLRITLILSTMGMLLASGEEDLVFTRLKSPPESFTETFYQVTKTGMMEIGGEVIHQISLQFEDGKSHATLSINYKNTTSEAVSPKCIIRLYNAYGILMGGIRLPADDETPETLIQSGKTGITALHPRITGLDSIFRHTNMNNYPSDFFSASWLSISDSNDTKVEKAAGKLAETQPESKSEETETSKTESK